MRARGAARGLGADRAANPAPQVHEKSVLLPLLPLTLLAADSPWLVTWINLAAVVGMFPLLKKDGLAVAYPACMLLYPAAMQLAQSDLLADSPEQPGNPCLHPTAWLAARLSLAAAVAIHVAAGALPPLERYPYLFDAAFVTLSFIHIAAAFLYAHWHQYLEFMRAPSLSKLRGKLS